MELGNGQRGCIGNVMTPGELETLKSFILPGDEIRFRLSLAATIVYGTVIGVLHSGFCLETNSILPRQVVLWSEIATAEYVSLQRSICTLVKIFEVNQG